MELRPVFEGADTNNSGKVTISEAAKALSEKYPNLDERGIKRTIYRFEKDGIVQYWEFIMFYANLKML